MIDIIIRIAGGALLVVGSWFVGLAMFPPSSEGKSEKDALNCESISRGRHGLFTFGIILLFLAASVLFK